jgi:DNA repair ATPase RecN|tara:strand:- start:48 stop:305 length:258 start_codon:yes stop_codon:yes gene_type:complete
MDEGLIVYIGSLLSERERQVKTLRKKYSGDPEVAMTVKQEADWELVIIAKSKEALKELNQEKKSYARRPSLRETQAMQARSRGGY